MKKNQRLKKTAPNSIKDLFDLSNYSTEDKILFGKYVSAIIVLVIIMCYSLNFAAKSKNYTFNTNNDSIFDSNLIYNWVYIAETPVGGLTKEQAVQVAYNGYGKTRLNGYTITVASEYGYSKTFTFGELGAEYDIEGIIDEAYDYNRSGSYASRLSAMDDLDGKTQHFTPEYSINEDTLQSAVDEIVRDVNKESSLKGKSVNAERTYEILFEKLQIQENDITIYVPENNSEVSS